MELEAEQAIGAGRYERSPERKAYRNGHRERTWETRVGEIPLRTSQLREGNYIPSLLEPRRRSERALLAMVQAAYVQEVSTRKVDDLLQAMGLTGVDKSRVSRVCQELDGLVQAFRSRPLQGSYAYLWLESLYLKVRQDHRIVNQAMAVAIGVRGTGERDVLGFCLGPNEEYTFSRKDTGTVPGRSVGHLHCATHRPGPAPAFWAGVSFWDRCFPEGAARLWQATEWLAPRHLRAS